MSEIKQISSGIGDRYATKESKEMAMLCYQYEQQLQEYKQKEDKLREFIGDIANMVNCSEREAEEYAQDFKKILDGSDE